MNTTTMTPPTPIDILAMARELLLERYLEEKAKILYQWTAMNDWRWQTEGKISDFPDMPEYPTMEEIVALAQYLQEYFAGSTNAENQTSTDEMPVTETWNIFEPVPGSVVEPTPEPIQCVPGSTGATGATGVTGTANVSTEQPAQPA